MPTYLYLSRDLPASQPLNYLHVSREAPGISTVGATSISAVTSRHVNRERRLRCRLSTDIKHRSISVALKPSGLFSRRVRQHRTAASCAAARRDRVFGLIVTVKDKDKNLKGYEL